MIPSYHLLAPRLRLITWHRVSNPLAHLRSRLSSRASLLGLGTTLECLWTPARGRAGRGPGRLRFEVGESSRDEMRSRRRDRACPRSGFFPGPSADKQHREQGEKQHLLCSTPFPWAATSSVNWKRRRHCCEMRLLCHQPLCGLFTVFMDKWSQAVVSFRRDSGQHTAIPRGRPGAHVLHNAAGSSLPCADGPWKTIR